MKTHDIVERFESAVEKYPDNTAIHTKDNNLSYEQLNKKVNQVTYNIRESTANKCRNVTLLLDHDEEVIIALLGVLKAGKTYVPIDPFIPLERAKKILNDSETDVLITNNNQMSFAYKLLSSSKKNITLINISGLENKYETNPELKIDGTQSAYVLYTSGSTGEPKGVAQSHQSVAHFIEGYINELDIKDFDNILLTTPYSHTVSVIDIFSALFTGASLSIIDVKKDRDASVFLPLVNKLGVTIIHTVPTLYRYMIKSADDISQLKDVRLVVLGGEEVLQNDVDLYKEKFSDKCLFVNLYGSSEVILATMYVIDKSYSNERKVVPVGFPFGSIKASILDENKNQVHVHGVGEIHFSSKFLDPQYYKDNEMTEAMFLDISEEEKLVRMGDLGKLLPDQSLQLMGRKDSQVKINGNRVNLNEIESCLNSDQVIKQSVLEPVKNDNSEISLVAFITAFEEKPDLEKIKNNLREKLPEYMIPSFFVKVEKFPITASGKIDRNSLPRISYKDLVNSRKKVENVEKSDLQKRILAIWQKVFEKEDITVNDNFFQLGGNSLMATEIVNEIHSSFNMEVELSTVFDYQSVFEMAMFLENAKSEQVA